MHGRKLTLGAWLVRLTGPMALIVAAWLLIYLAGLPKYWAHAPAPPPLLTTSAMR